MTPLSPTNAPFSPGKAVTFRLLAQRGAPPVPAIGEDLSISAFRLPDRKEVRLRVREARDGVYDAEFVPEAPGQFLLAVAVRGQPLRALPVTFGVYGPIAGSAAANAGGQAGAGALPSRSQATLDGSVSHRRR